VSDAVTPAPYPFSSWPAAAPATADRTRPRLWPGLALVVLQAGLIFVPRWVAPGTEIQFYLLMLGTMGCGAGVLLWWLFLSRVPWRERLIGLVSFVVATFAAILLGHPTFRFGLFLYVLPLTTTVWVLWLVASLPLGGTLRRVGLVALFAVIAAGACLPRMAGVYGSFVGELHWRWTLTPEERFLAEHQGRDSTTGGELGTMASQVAEWPGFRGPARDGRLAGVRIDTDWAAHPPRKVWRQLIGPGWSSFAVVGSRIYTQEQRGDVEAIVCYNADNGEEVWAHTDAARFSDDQAGAGPRATPTFHAGNIYALGTKGRLNCLDAATGAVVWSRDAAKDAGAPVPVWGFASSPLVYKGLVTVFTGGPGGKAVSAYDATKEGPPVWMSGDGQHSYCSPHPATLGGVEQIVMASDAGVEGLDPVKGDVLWWHESPTGGYPRCVQPALIDDTDLLLGTGMGKGDRRVHVERQGDSWGDATEVWTSKRLNPYFNDRVIHKGHIYGFDNNMFTCLSLDKGARRWQRGDYGHGQVLLLADQDLLLILSEEGEVVLVAADPQKHRELGRFQALPLKGKTWNHPVVANGRLYVRNGEEAACYELLPAP
jgi:outer membrane protein assembly factor BamB